LRRALIKMTSRGKNDQGLESNLMQEDTQSEARPALILDDVKRGRELLDRELSRKTCFLSTTDEGETDAKGADGRDRASSEGKG